MSLGYFSRYRFNSLTNPGEDDTKMSDLNAESGNLLTETDDTHGPVSRLDGSTSLVSVNKVSLISGNGHRSLTFWAKTDNNAGDYAPVVSYGNSFVFYTRKTGMHPEFCDLVSRIPGNSVISGSWYFFAATSSPGSLEIYIDGQLDTSHSVSLHTSDGVLRIGTERGILRGKLIGSETFLLSCCIRYNPVHVRLRAKFRTEPGNKLR